MLNKKLNYALFLFFMFWMNLTIGQSLHQNDKNDKNNNCISYDQFQNESIMSLNDRTNSSFIEIAIPEGGTDDLLFIAQADINKHNTFCTELSKLELNGMLHVIEGNQPVLLMTIQDAINRYCN